MYVSKNYGIGTEVYTPAKLHLIYQNNEKCKFFNAWKLSIEPVALQDEVTFDWQFNDHLRCDFFDDRIFQTLGSRAERFED
jgi:hypothetical protein